jgi:ferredoxin-NADP reductase
VVAEGRFGVAVRRCDRAMLVAGGTGTTPMRALPEEVHGDVVIYRIVREQDAVLRKELEALVRERGARVELVAGNHAAADGAGLLSAEHLAQVVPDLDRRDVHVCGPPAMAAAFIRGVRRAGVPSPQLHVERFGL